MSQSEGAFRNSETSEYSGLIPTALPKCNSWLPLSLISYAIQYRILKYELVTFGHPFGNEKNEKLVHFMIYSVTNAP